jgi:hypothetical protein
MSSIAGGSARPWVARLPWVLLAVTTALVVASLPLSFGHEPLSDTLLYGLIGLTVGVTGAFVASRQPRNPIGWVLCAQGLVKSQLEAWGEGFGYHHLPTAALGGWIKDWIWIVDGAAYPVVFLLFPTGYLLSRPWRWVLWLLGASVLIVIAAQDTTSTVFVVGIVLFLIGTAGSIVSLAVRFLRSSGTERLQLKQLVLAACLILPTMAVSAFFYLDSVLVQSLLGLAFLALPVAVGVAILRHRLYDIDVVINRALVYGALTATLALVYLTTVLLLQVALDPVTSGSSVAVALSTLAVAALFRPARERIQRGVDRRFFRARYDRSVTLTRFALHVRDQVDLGEIGDDLLEVVRGTLQPAHVSLWVLAPEPPGAPR